MTDEILTVHHVTYDWGSYAVRCPHCKEFIYVEGDHMDEIRGEQYQHKTGCGGWFEVSFDAKFVDRI